jgi:class 3 adenylate cyclase
VARTLDRAGYDRITARKHYLWRVQQLADAEEIFVSEDVYSAEGVQALLASREVASDVFRLKGIQQDLRVFRITKDLTAS